MIGENLLTLRKRHGYSQEEVAGRIGVSRQAVAKWESGETLPDLSNTAALARLYDVSLDDLVNYRGDEPLPLPPSGKHLFGVVTLGDKGQIVIPARCRRVFGLKPGDELVVLGDETRGIALLRQSELMTMVEQIRQQRKEGCP